MRLLLALLLLVLAACAPDQPANLSGRVTLNGAPPAPGAPISMDAEAACAAMHPTPAPDESAVVAADGSVANVFVYIKSGLEGKTFPPPTTAVAIEQKGCLFGPRVLGVMKGQFITVKNSDPVTHNIHPMPKNNRDWNQSQAPGAEDLKRRFGFAEVMIPVKCNVHAWMRSYIGVLDHPFFAVTGRDGRFTIPNLPPGQYTIAAWHERFGEITRPLTVTSGSALVLDLAFVSDLPK